MAVTQTMTFTATPPVIGDTPEVFESRAVGVWNELKNTTIPDLNTAFTQMNALETNVNAKEVLATNAADTATAQAVIATEQALIASAAASSLPDGVINDTTITLEDTWSSSKISSELSGKASTSHAHAINDITDVDTTGLVNNDVLTYNSTSGQWEAAPTQVPTTTRKYAEFTGNTSYYSFTTDTTPAVIATIDSTRALLVYDDGADTVAAIATVSAGILTLGTPFIVSTTNTYNSYCISPYNGGFVVTMNAVTTPTHIVVLQVSGSVISKGTVATLVATTGNIDSHKVIMLTSTTGIFVYEDVTTAYPTAVAFTISGTTVTVGTAVTLLSVTLTTFSLIGIGRMSDTRALVLTNKTAKVLTVTGSTIAQGADYALPNSGLDYTDVAYASATDAIIIGRDSVMSKLSISTATITGYVDLLHINSARSIFYSYTITSNKHVLYTMDTDEVYLMPSKITASTIDCSSEKVGKAGYFKTHNQLCYLSSGYMITIGELNSGGSTQRITLLEVLV